MPRRRRLIPSAIAAALLLVSVGAGSPLPAQPSPGAASSSRKAPDSLISGIARWDADSDGVLTCQEWKRYAERLFRRSDGNGDGMLEREEFSTLGKYEPVFAKADLGYFDDDQDGRLSLREFVDKPSPLFVRYDRNGDCQLTADEIRGNAAAGEQQKAPPGGPKGAGGMPGPPSSK